MTEHVKNIYVDDKLYHYITMLAEETRKHEYVKLGVSPRGAIALCSMAKAGACVKGRDYVVPEDISRVFKDVCRHRLILHPKAALSDMDADGILDEILEKTSAPKLDPGA